MDLSSHMLAYARRRAADEGIENVSFQQVDAQIHPFETAAFDVAISNTGALAAGRDLPAPPPDAPGPLALSDPDRVRSILTRAGCTHVELEAASEGMWFGTDALDAYQLILGLLGWMLEGLDDDGRARAFDALRSTKAKHETPDGVIFDSAAWVVRATRP